jgi:hypothetical protein
MKVVNATPLALEDAADGYRASTKARRGNTYFCPNGYLKG